MYDLWCSSSQAKWLEPGTPHLQEGQEGYQPSWHEFIFPQAAQICRNEHQKALDKERQQEAQIQAQKQKEKQTREEKQAERERMQILAQLMAEGGDGKSTTKKRQRSSKGKSKRA